MSISNISKKARIAFFIIIFFNIIIASWYVLNGDIHFQADIARDFLILAEVEQKKIILIGARAGAAGTFHGVFWPYLNFPVYFLSGGNPVAVGWFWIVLMLISFVIGYQITKRIFNKETAFYFVLLSSIYLMFHAKEFTHPMGAFLLMPSCFYMFWKYVNNYRLKYLAVFVLLAGLLIQLEMAFGIPFFVLSLVYILFQQIKHGKLKHSLVFLLILIPLSTYILFDIRHDFLQLKSLLAYMKGNDQEYYVGFLSIIINRLDYMSGIAVPLLLGVGPDLYLPLLNKVFAIVFFIFLLKLINKSKQRKFYSAALYFFFGYFVLSLSNRYYLLLQHFMAFVPIVFMVIASLIASKYRKVLFPLLIFAIIVDEIAGIKFISIANKFIGKAEGSWKLMSKIADDVFKGSEIEFGYFVYSPDKLAYGTKYAMIYAAKKHSEKKAYYFEKKPITYVISSPPPTNDPYMRSEWWIINSIYIDKPAQKILSYSNGYKTERYELTPQEVKVPVDQHEDTGLHFR